MKHQIYTVVGGWMEGKAGVQIAFNTPHFECDLGVQKIRTKMEKCLFGFFV